MYKVPHLVQRKIEAEMIGRIYANLREALDQDAALKIISDAIEEAAQQEGQAFAARAKEPQLAHFKSIRDAWGDALQAVAVEETDDLLRFNVVRCRYVELYRELGLPPELVRILSCARDAPFARGYSPSLKFSRSGTLADGASACDFCYRWRD